MTLLLSILACRPNPTLVDIQFINGQIHTQTGVVNQLSINQGIVVETSADIEATTTIDLDGKSLLPSFHDSHTHLLAGSFVSDKLLLVGASSMTSIRAKLRDYVNTEPDLPWIVGYGWLKSTIDNPNGVMLDEVSKDYPVALFDSAGHSLLVNSKAMELAGINQNTETPVGGIIHLDQEGYPTGFLQEAAIELVSPLMVSQFSSDQLSANLLDQIALFHQAGITSVSEILAVPGVNLTFPELYHQYEDLNFRVAYYVPIFALDQLNDISLYKGDQSPWVHFEGVKIWVDGSSGSGESWSLEASDIDEEHFGSHYFDENDLRTVFTDAEDQGYNVKLHVNGDAAVRAALNALEVVADQNNGLSQQYLFEHAVLIDPADYDRIATLGVTVSIQPAHALVGIYGDQADHWYEERIGRAWDFPALESEGINLVMGTDWPVWPTVDGFTNWQTALSGLNTRNLQTDTIFEGYTTLGRSSSGLSDVGLEVGQQADFIIVNGDPFTDVTNSTLEQTWVGGKRVY